jgi:outer membrane protein assembly factor BamA
VTFTKVFALLFVLFFFFHIAQGQESFKCVWSFDQEQHIDCLEKVPERFFLSQLTFSADIPFEREELVTILGFDEQQKVTREQLIQAFERIRYKEKFEHVIVYGRETNFSTVNHLIAPGLKHNSISLHLAFSSWWTVSKVRCKGTVLGKDRFRHQYRMVPGARFDAIKHADSLILIEGELQNIGHVGAHVTDILEYDEERKTVSITLYLEPGQLYTIKHLTIEVGSAQSKSELRTSKWEKILIRHLYGLTYTQQLIQQAERTLEELVAQEGFLEPKIQAECQFDHEAKKVSVCFNIQLQERRLFRFFGNHFFSERQLLDRLMLFGNSALLLPPPLLIEELLNVYVSKGFWKASITHQEENDECLFCITEGPRATITNVTAEGVQHPLFFSSEALRKIFSPLIRGSFFDKQKQRSCRDALMQEYMRAGFWGCKIVKEEFLSDPSSGDNAYRYHLIIDEGVQHMLRSIFVPQFEEIFDKKLFTPYKKCKEHAQSPVIPFDAYLVQEQRRVLMHTLQATGRLYANPKPFLKQNGQGVIDLTWQIEHNQPVTFGSTMVTGSTRLPIHCICRELCYNSGGLWDSKKIDQSLTRLKALGIFEQVSLQPVPDPDDVANIHVKDLVLTCIDDDPFELRLRLGTQFIGQNFRLTELGARGGGSFIWKNPSNKADLFKINVNISPFIRTGELTYTLPWLFNRPIKTTLSAYSSLFDQQLTFCFREKLYSVFQNGFQASFEHNDECLKRGCNIGLEWVRIGSISDPLARLIDFTPRLVDVFVGFFILEPLILWTYLDDPLNPRIGGTTLFSAKVMAPLKKTDTALCKFIFEQSAFVPMGVETVLAFRLRLGHIFFNDFSHTMPSERFYLGGAFNLRGYDTDMVPPLNEVICRGKPCLVPLGGKSMINGMVELRFPLFDQVGAVVFTDFGILSQQGPALIDSGNLAGATGFGLRYATPIGPVRFDIAWKWKRYAPQEGAFAWFLTLGNAF